jgi:hypothetical protein
MMTPSTPKNTSISSIDDHSKSLVTDNIHICPHCGNSAPPYQDPDYPNVAARCRACGRKETDVSGFYIIDKKTNCLASPEFATLAETKQFAAIFGMTSYAGYGLRECTYLINGQRDEHAWRGYLERLALASQVLVRLVELQHAYTEPGDLKRLAIFLHLDRYALPQFREQPMAGRAD